MLQNQYFIKAFKSYQVVYSKILNRGKCSRIITVYVKYRLESHGALWTRSSMVVLIFGCFCQQLFKQSMGVIYLEENVQF